VLATVSPAAPSVVTLGYPYAGRCPDAGERDDVDRWRMNTCNCTSYVAWALDANGYRTDWFVAGAMDALNWPNVARRRHLHVGRTPRPGAVAVWPRVAPPFGHVAFVTSVHRDGRFDVAEYNLPGRPEFSFDTRARLFPRGVVFVYVPRRRS
jgi:surface antigen